MSVPLWGYAAQLAEPGEAPEQLTFQMALQRAIEHDPRLSLNAVLTEVAQGQVEQADQRPNPVVGIEIENFLGTGPVSGMDGAEVTIGISQVIETARKRNKRAAFARTGEALLDSEQAILLAEIESRVRRAFVKALLAREYVNLREEELALALESERESSRLVEAARSPQVERTRATLAVRQQEFALERSMRNLESAKRNLTALWGRPSDVPFEISGELVLGPDVPDFDELVNLLPKTARLSRFEALRNHRRAELDLEQARAASDFEVFAGGRYYNEADGDFGFVAGIEVPLPLFDRNSGNIRTARAQVRAVGYEHEVARRELMIQLNEAYQELASAHAEANSVQEDLLPVAEQTLVETSEGYEKGQYNQLAVLESRKVLFEVREAYLDALNRFAMAQVEIEAMTRPATSQRQN